MDSTYPTANGMESYHVRGVPQGFVLMFVAGVLFGIAGDWLRRGQGAGHGQGHEAAVQSVDYHF